MNEDFLMLLEEFEREKGISRDVLIEALETALVSAYKRNYGSANTVRVEINKQTGNMDVFIQKTVVDKVEDPSTQNSG